MKQGRAQVKHEGDVCSDWSVLYLWLWQWLNKSKHTYTHKNIYTWVYVKLVKSEYCLWVVPMSASWFRQCTWAGKKLLLTLSEATRTSLYCICSFLGFPGGSVVKNLPAVQETQEMWVQSLGQEDPLEEEVATHSSILAWKIPWTQQPGRLQPMGSWRVRHDWVHTHTCRNL